MDINLTLVVQMLVFLAFVWFTMKLVWPPIEKALQERQDKIAEGLAAAEKGRKELELTQHRIRDDLKQSKVQASEIIDKANKRAGQMVDEARDAARHEAQLQAKIAKEQLDQEVNAAKESLKKQVSLLAIAGAEKIIEREVDKKTSKALLDKMIEEI